MIIKWQYKIKVSLKEFNYILKLFDIKKSLFVILFYIFIYIIY